jgi:response regulator RpfG family c-di-GMP phosphodiesterase
MDIRMPVMDGLEATRRIKSTESGKATVIVALTAHALEEEREVILAAGCDDFVRKPYREQDIFDVMAKHLGLRYVYAEEPVESPAAETVVEPDAAQLAALPSELREELYDAALRLNPAQTLSVIEKIERLDTSAAVYFKKLANNLDFGLLLALLEENKMKLT